MLIIVILCIACIIVFQDAIWPVLEGIFKAIGKVFVRLLQVGVIFGIILLGYYLFK